MLVGAACVADEVATEAEPWMTIIRQQLTKTMRRTLKFQKKKKIIASN